MVTKPRKVVSGIWIVLLVAFAAYLWWFGADVAWSGWEALWVPLSLPLYIATHWVTRKWSAYWGLLVAIGLVVVASLAFAQIGERGFFILSIGLPFIVTYLQVRVVRRQVPEAAETAGRFEWRALARDGAALLVLLLGIGYWTQGMSGRLPLEPEAIPTMAGCYDFKMLWLPASAETPMAALLRDSRLKLDTIPGTDRFETRGLLVRQFDGSDWGAVVPGSTSRWMAYWVPHRQNRLTIIWTTGFHGVRMRLRGTSGGLRGTAVERTDVSGPTGRARARIRATRIDCV